MHINCDIWLQVQDMNMSACSLTAWKCLEFHWQSDPETFVSDKIFAHMFLQLWPKKKSLFLSKKKRILNPLPVRVKHGQEFQNTNYNWRGSWNLLKAVIWLIYPPSTFCCWSLEWLPTSQSAKLCIPKKAYKAFSSCESTLMIFVR